MQEGIPLTLQIFTSMIEGKSKLLTGASDGEKDERWGEKRGSQEKSEESGESIFSIKKIGIGGRKTEEVLNG